MTAVDNPAYGTDLLDTLSQRVMVGGGAMGTQLAEAGLTRDGFNHLEGCNETGPVVTERIHRNYFEAGAEAAEAKCVRPQSG